VKLEVKGVDFSYKNHEVLHDLCFSADSGDVVAVLGPNGVGKSTLFRCLLGFLQPCRGEILISGKSVRDMSSAETARHIAYIPQTVSPVFNYTVLDTVLMGFTNKLGTFMSPGVHENARAIEILDSLGIAHLKNRGCGQISGGERQLTLLARALAQDAGILIMDEPTANLDYGNSWHVMERIGSLAHSGYTVIFSTHDPNQAFMHASNALVMKGGRIIACGAPADTLDGELLSALYNINVAIHKLPYNGKELPVSLPDGGNSENMRRSL